MNVKKLLQDNNLIDKNGRINKRGWEVFSEFLDFVGPYPDLTPGKIPSPNRIFNKYLSKVVPASIELILIQDKKIYLTYREDGWFKGWHTPGGYIRPREGVKEGAQRIANAEALGIKVVNTEIITGFSAVDNPRFHDVPLLVLTSFEGEPSGGRWFEDFPPDFIEVQQRYIPAISRYL